MAKKKMCPLYGKKDDCFEKCPANANSYCEIIPPKEILRRMAGFIKYGEKCRSIPPVPPKEKDVVVRAWAWLSLNGDIGAATVNACGSKVPCTITVKAEDMRKARK